MGSDLWEHQAPWTPIPDVALRELQAQFLSENIDFPSLVSEQLSNARETVRLTEEDGDRYNILEIYKEDLAYLEQLASSTLPTDPQEIIGILRKMNESGGEGLGNVLDVESISGDGMCICRPLLTSEIQSIFGHGTPTVAEAEANRGRFANQLERGESICFPIYDEEQKPIGWWFVGCTLD